MSKKEKTKLQVLLAILALLCVSLLLNFTRNSTPSPSSPVIQRVSHQEQKSESPDTLPLLAEIRQPHPLFTESQRNVFEFQGDESSEPDPDSPDADTAALNDPTAAAADGPASPDVTYLGYYREKGDTPRKLAAISNGGTIYVGGVGQTLAGKYKVVSVEDELLVIVYLPDGRTLRLPLGRPENTKPQ